MVLLCCSRRSRRVEDANLGKKLQVPTTFVNTVTYNYAVMARQIMVENFKVVVIKVVAGKDIGNEHQRRGLADTSLAEKNDGVRRIRRVKGAGSLTQSICLTKE